MANEILSSADERVVHVRITGKMTCADQKFLEDAARHRIDHGGPISVLLTLDNFEGWARDEGWGDNLEFAFSYADKIVAIAIVGDEKWQQEVLVFLGQGFRRTLIRYFSPSAMSIAEDWLKST